MKVKVSCNSKELSALVGDSKDGIEWDWEIDVYTESGEVSKRGELAIFAGMYWALMSMLPWRIVSNFTDKWNGIIGDFHSKVKQEAEALKEKEALIVPDKVEPAKDA